MEQPQDYLDVQYESSSESEPEPEPTPAKVPKREAPPLWESMQPRRRDPSEPLDETEARLIKVFKENHIINAPEASQDMEMIYTRSICKKCLLFRHVCQIIGNHVKENSGESQTKKHPLISRRYSR